MNNRKSNILIDNNEGYAPLDINREDMEFAVPEDKAPEDKLPLACISIFESASCGDKKKLKAGLTVLSTYIDIDMDSAAAPDELVYVNKIIKTQITNSLNALEKDGMQAQINAIDYILNIHLDDMHRLKDALTLYQESMQKIMKTHILMLLMQKKTKALKGRFSDFFAELEVSTLDDQEKSRILFTILQGLMLNDPTKILELEIKYSGEKWIEQWEANVHLESALNQIRDKMEQLRQVDIDNEITQLENKMFHQQVACWKLLRTCEYHIKYLEDIVKADPETERGRNALKSFNKVTDFYTALKAQVNHSFDANTVDDLKKQIANLKQQLTLPEITSEDKYFITFIEPIVIGHQPKCNYLQELITKLSSLSMLKKQKRGGRWNWITSWPKRDTDTLQRIIGRIKGKNQDITTQTFMDALIENEKMDTDERTGISHECITHYVEYLKCMEEIADFQNWLHHLHIDDAVPAITYELAKMQPALLNNVLEKITVYLDKVNMKEGTTLPIAKKLLESIKVSLENINQKRYEKGEDREGASPLTKPRYREGLKSVLDDDPVLAKPENKKNIFAISRLSYISKPSCLADQQALLYRWQTINTLGSSCEVFKIHLANKIESLLTNEIRNEIRNKLNPGDAYQFSLGVKKDLEDDYTKQSLGDPSIEAIVLQIKDAMLNKKQPIYRMVANEKNLINAVNSYLAIQELQDCLRQDEDHVMDPYEKLLAFEAKFGKYKDMIEKEKTIFSAEFLKAVAKKQNSDIVLHHACHVFAEEMAVKAAAFNDQKFSSQKEKKTYLQRYHVATELKKSLGYHRTRPQNSLDLFKEKLNKHAGIFEKHEDDTVTKFLRAIAGVFGYDVKPSSTERFYVKAKHTLFAADTSYNSCHKKHIDLKEKNNKKNIGLRNR